jgi:integrase/recombinase XerD
MSYLFGRTSYPPVGGSPLQTNLEKAFEDFLKYMEGNRASPTTIKSYKSTFQRFSYNGYGVVDDGTVSSFIANAGYKNPATINKAIAHLGSFVTWAQKKKLGWVIGTWTLRKQKVDIDVPKILSEDEYHRWESMIRDFRAQSFAILMWYTGMRFHEVQKLTQKAYYEPIPGQPGLKIRGKGGRERIVPLSPLARPAFEFWTGNTKLSESALRREFADASRRSGVKVNPHWLRHTFASRLRDKGATYEDIADILGNTVEVTRERYSRVNMRALGGLVNSL